MTSAPFGSFFLPGPTEVRPEVLAAMSAPMIPHRGAAFAALFEELQEGLRPLFGTTRPVFLAANSATGLMEMAIRNAPDGPILSLVNGAFSARFADIARACDREVRVVRVEYGDTVSAAQLEEALQGTWCAAVTVVHVETSTGAMTALPPLADCAHAHGAMLLVDSVTGVASTPMQTDAWQLDFVLTGSQKALALPPGLALGVASEAFVLQAGARRGRGRYFDVVEYEQASQRSQVPNTPALSLLYALRAQLAAIAAEGLEARFARHAAMRARVDGWALDALHDELIGGIVAREGMRCPGVTAFRLRDGMQDRALIDAVAGRGFTIGGGYGPLAGQTWRFGHMGDHTLATIEPALTACRDALRTLPR